MQECVLCAVFASVFQGQSMNAGMLVQLQMRVQPWCSKMQYESVTW
jgi:hypothetical protein